MVDEVIDDIRDKYYVFFNDLNYKEINKRDFESLDTEFDGVKILLKVHKYNVGTIKSIYRGFFAHSGYAFYDVMNKKITPQFGEFKLYSIYEKRDRSREVIYRIQDGNLNSRDLLNTEMGRNFWEYYQITGVKNILELLKNLSEVQGFKILDLTNEISNLKKEVKILNGKVKWFRDNQF